MSDVWPYLKNISLINILVNNPGSILFLKSIEASEQVKDVGFIFKLLDNVVKEIGEQIIVQIIFDNASVYRAVENILMEKRKHLY